MRTLKQMKEDHQQFRLVGRENTKKAKEFHNVVHLPLWKISLSNVSPPFLHIVLGVVKNKHHDLLEGACHGIDDQIAIEKAEQDTAFGPNIELFDVYTKQLQKISQTTEEVTELKERYERVIAVKYLTKQKKKSFLNKLQNDIDAYENDIDEYLKVATLGKRSGPVTANLEENLTETQHQISCTSFQIIHW